MKLVKDSTQRQYELTYLLAGDLLDAELAKIHKDIDELVSKFQGKIIKQEDWGRKRLAYTIHQNGKSQTEAVFTHLLVSFKPTQVAKINKELALNHQVLRYLLVSSDEEEAKAKDQTTAKDTAKATEAESKAA